MVRTSGRWSWSKVIRRQAGLSAAAVLLGALSGTSPASAAISCRTSGTPVYRPGVVSPPQRVDPPAAHATVATGMDADGRLEVFAVDDDGMLIQSWQLQPNGAWSGWRSMGVAVGPVVYKGVVSPDGPSRGRPSVGRAPDGRLELFAVDNDGRIIHAWQVAPNGTWSEWHEMGEVAREAPSVSLDGDGRLELFAAAPDGSVITSWQVAPNGTWSGWQRMDAVVPDPWRTPSGKVVEAPSAVVDLLGCQHLYGSSPLTATNLISNDMFADQPAANAPFTAWRAYGVGSIGSSSFTVTADGTIRKFATNGEDLYFDGGAGYQWLGLKSHHAPTVAMSADGRMEVFAKSYDGHLVHKWEAAPNVWSTSTYGAWFDRGILVSEPPTVAVAPDGRLELFATTPSGELLQSWQLTPNGTWSNWLDRGVHVNGSANPA